ncbi:MAG TPA: hypothetical protein VFL91_08440 [Thermomicrobiales bacterium]|nr:hypothetical protein [Thermomicrobiales bacterium]
MPVVTFYGGPLDGEERVLLQVPPVYDAVIYEQLRPAWMLDAADYEGQGSYRTRRYRYRCTEGMDGRWRAVATGVNDG